MSITTVLVQMRGPTLFGLLCATLFGYTARGDEPRLSISGYDPVAYFTDGKPIPGKPDSLLSGSGVVIWGQAWLPAGAKVFPF